MNPTIKKLVFLIAMLMEILPTSAYTFEADNLIYEIISLDKMTCGVVRQSDTQNMTEIIIPSTVLYNGKDLKVISIYDNAFEEDNINSIDMSNAMYLETIGESAFKNCLHLTEVKLSPVCKEINAEAFASCDMTTIAIPSTCEYLGSKAFCECKSLQQLIFEPSENPLSLGCKKYYKYNSHDSNNYYDFGQFGFCPIRDLNIQRNIFYVGRFDSYSKALDDIGDTYFDPWIDQCSESLTIGPNVTRIPYNLLLTTDPENLILEDSALDLDIEPLTTYVTDPDHAYNRYYGQYNITDEGYIVIAKRGDSNLAKNFFRGFYMQNLKSIKWGRKVTANKFDDTNTKLVSINAPDLQLFELGEDLTEFGAVEPLWTNISEIKWNEVIKECTFFYATPYIMELNFPESLEVISGFNGAQATEIHFGSNLKKISGFNCWNIEAIYISTPTPPQMNAFNETIYIESTLYVPAGSLEAYSQASNWKNFWNIKEFQPNSIDLITNSDIHTNIAKFDLNGNQVDDQYKGVVIVRYSDGSTKKVLQK